MIELDDIHVIFNKGKPLEKHALKGINLKIANGSFVTVIGSNGSGKSTLLGTLAGDVLPTKGRICFNDIDISHQNTTRRAALVARVFQDPLIGSCGNLSIEENLALAFQRGKNRGLGLALKKRNRELFRQRLSELNLGLENRLHEMMGSLSGGQRQAVSLIMATLSTSDILLLDEHTAALDPSMAEFIMKLTHEFVENHRFTTLMVTHSMRQALDFGTRTIMIDDGKVILDVTGEQRNKLTVNDLIEMFHRVRGQADIDGEMLVN